MTITEEQLRSQPDDSDVTRGTFYFFVISCNDSDIGLIFKLDNIIKLIRFVGYLQ
jgi:hypothetical protein